MRHEQITEFGKISWLFKKDTKENFTTAEVMEDLGNRLKRTLERYNAKKDKDDEVKLILEKLQSSPNIHAIYCDPQNRERVTASVHNYLASLQPEDVYVFVSFLPGSEPVSAVMDEEYKNWLCLWCENREGHDVILECFPQVEMIMITAETENKELKF